MTHAGDSIPEKNTIRSWALGVVAITSLVLIAFGAWLIYLLSSDWCGTAVGVAADADARPEAAVRACFDLLGAQVDALAFNSHVVMLTFALCLGVLVVIVLAGGHLSFRASKTGVSADVGRQETRGARRVEAAARQERQEIEQEVAANPADDDFFEEKAK